MLDSGFELNARQREACETTEGFIRVIAGAGSGKTRTIAARFAYLVTELGILPSSILCVTFTNKAAGEMRSRIHSLIGDEDTGMITTFHGFCNSVLKEESHQIHYPKSFLVLDNSDIDSMLKIIYEQRGLNSRDMTFSKARDMIEIQKIYKQPEYYLSLISLSLEELYEKYMRAKQPEDIIFLGYLYQQKKNFGLDYNDLIILTLYLFERDEETARKWQEKLEYIMIDEFQDIDDLQYRLMKVLSAYHRNLFVVGDPDQTIYTWRGANVRYLLDFEQNFPGTQTIYLNENYRSTPQILQAANTLISKNVNRIPKDLHTHNFPGPVVRALHAKSARKEAEMIAGLIEELTKQGYSYKDITILYRAHYMSRSVEDVLLEREIPYTIYSGVSFFQRMEIKDALSYLRMLVNRDDLDFRRVINTPKRNIGTTRMKFLEEYAEKHRISLYQALRENVETERFRNTQAAGFIDLIEGYDWRSKPVSQVLSEILDLSGSEAMMRLSGSQERLDNLAELKQSVQEYEISSGEEADLEQYLNHVALYTSADQETKADKVRMMTIHTAKGLEFPVVIMTGLSESMFPSRQTRTLEQMEEERRLCFVALTRAREQLYLFEAEGALAQSGLRVPSRFLSDIGEPVLKWEPRPSDELLRRTALIVESKPGLSAKSKEMPAFQPGDRVRHKVFGEGTVMETDSVKMTVLVHFDQLDTLRKLSMRASLEKTGERREGLGLN